MLGVKLNTRDQVYYLLAGPRLAEALDPSTVEPLTGAARSTPKPLTTSKPLHSQQKYAEKHEQNTVGWASDTNTRVPETNLGRTDLLEEVCKTRRKERETRTTAEK